MQSHVQITRGTDAVVRVVAGGNHVTNVLPAGQSAGLVDAVRVLAEPGGGPPPHRHAFGEWFYVEQGELQITGERDGRIAVLTTARAGDSVWVPPNVWHGTVNGSDAAVRFMVIGVPGVMTSYFEQAGIVVPDEQAAPPTSPPGPGHLIRIAADHNIQFFDAGPTNR